MKVKLYRGDGIAAGLFYEAKVAEAVSLVVEEQKKLLTRKEKQLTDQDISTTGKCDCLFERPLCF